MRLRGGGVGRQNRGRGRGGRGHMRVPDEIRATLVDHVLNHGLTMARGWSKDAAKCGENKCVLNNSDFFR